jgi:serine/threonine protein kinase
MQAPSRSPVTVLFPGFRLDLRAGELCADDGKTLRLPDQPFRILKMLLEHRSEVVSREELRKCLWPNDTIVEFEHSISAAMNRLRQALGDSAEQPRFIETLARRGYRFMVPVQFEEPVISPVPAASELIAPNESPVAPHPSHYQVLELLGGGGMGVVYKAKDTRLNRPVALKFLPAELADNAAALERFRREAQAASALNHPNICTIYDVGELPLEVGGGKAAQRFIAMEFLDGQTLERRIAGKPLPLQETLDLAIEIADALSTAHAEGIIHRDIKSANVFVTKRGSAKVLDFGLAKLTSQGIYEQHSHCAAPAPAAPAGITVMGKAMGTPTYMSPEQVRGEDLDVRSDLFSFGVILYQMATGVLPFRGENPDAITDSILHRAPESPSRLNPAIPARLEEVILKALEKDRRFRYQFAAEIRTDLQRLKREIAAEQAAEVAPQHKQQADSDLGGRWKARILSGAIAVALAMAVAIRLHHRSSLPARMLPLPNLTPAAAEVVSAQAKKSEANAAPAPHKPLARRRPVDLSSDFNATGFYVDGRSVRSDGLDGLGNAFPEAVLSAAKVWDGVPFSLGPVNAPDTVTSRTVGLPTGTFDSLKMLAIGVNGDQESQIFRVIYSDGLESSFTQSISDWYTPENYSGESDVAATPYRLGSGGGRDERTFHLYGYTFRLNARKKVRAFVLPANSGVKVFGLTLVRGSAGDASSAR